LKLGILVNASQDAVLEISSSLIQFQAFYCSLFPLIDLQAPAAKAKHALRK